MSHVVVVGGGISGLSAALQIIETSSDTSVTVVESRDRVGGRTHSVPVNRGSKHVIDLGGMWIGPTQDKIADVAAKLGVETFMQYHKGRKIVEIERTISTYNSDIPSIGIRDIIDLQLIIWKLEGMAKQISDAAPQDYPNAQSFDIISLSQYLSDRIRPATKKLIQIATRVMYGTEPSEISLLYFLHYVKCGQGLERMINIKDGLQEKLFVGGSQQISEKMAERLVKSGRCKLLTAQAVTTIDQEEWSVKVITADGTALRGDYAVVAMPPTAARHISYSPPLPPRKMRLMDNNFMGKLMKVIVVYSEPHWRHDGYSGEAMSDCCDIESSPVFFVTDYCKGESKETVAKAKAEGSGFGAREGDEGPLFALCGFIGGDLLVYWEKQTIDQRKDAITKQFQRWYGGKKWEEKVEYLTPISYHEYNWCGDEWARGGPVACMPPGTMCGDWAVAAVPCGRIHWAGTELATRHAGFMDGAVSSGRRAAAEVLERIALDEEQREMLSSSDKCSCRMCTLAQPVVDSAPQRGLEQGPLIADGGGSKDENCASLSSFVFEYSHIAQERAEQQQQQRAEQSKLRLSQPSVVVLGAAAFCVVAVAVGIYYGFENQKFFVS